MYVGPADWYIVPRMNRTPEEPALQSAHGAAAEPPSLLRNRNFLLLWAAYGVSATGDHISEMALLKARDAMHAPNLTQLQAMISFMFMLPFFVLGPVTGLLADRLPRRGIMIFADLVRAAIMFNFVWLLSIFGQGGHWLAFVPLMIVGIFAALFSPARSALLPTLIDGTQLVRANAMTSGLGVIATMISVAVGGYLAERYDPSVSFHVDAGTFLASTLLLMFITRPRQEAVRLAQPHSEAGLKPAIEYIRTHRRVIQLIIIAVVVWLCGATVRSTIPAIVRDVYHQSYQSMGLFQARLGLGMLTGAIILTALGDALRGEIAITWSLFGVGIAIGILGLSVLLPLPTFVAYHLGGLAIIFAGVFAAGVMASYNALLQRIVPNRLRGRVFGLSDVATMAGLLLATGLIGIPEWPQIDRWVGWILLGVTAIVMTTSIASLMVRLERGGRMTRRQRFAMNLNEFYCKAWFGLRREGICTVPREGPVVIVANHTSGIDPILIIASCPYRPVGFLIAEEYYDLLPVLRWFIRVVDCVPVRRGENDVGAFKEALRHLRSGKPLGIFPAGRIPAPGEAVEPHDGAVVLALRSGAPVVPVQVSGTVYDGNVGKCFLRRQRTRVRFGPPIDLSSYGKDPDKQTLHEISRMLMRKVDELGQA